jgi:hypothetical protein
LGIINNVFFVWIIYKLIHRILLTRKLIWVHILSTLLVLILLSAIGFWHNKISPPIKGDMISYQNLIDHQKRERIIALPIAIIFILGQLSFIVNLVGGLFKRSP